VIGGAPGIRRESAEEVSKDRAGKSLCRNRKGNAEGGNRRDSSSCAEGALNKEHLSRMELTGGVKGKTRIP